MLGDEKVLEHRHPGEEADVLERARDFGMIGNFMVGHAFEQMVDTQQRYCLIQRHTALRRRHATHAELQIAPHRQVGEQVGLLKHITD